MIRKFFQTSLTLVVGTLIIYAQNIGDEKHFPALDTLAFNNSSHHWYDIYDQEKLIQPKPNQPRYQPTEVAKIADNILLYQKNNGGWPKNYDMLAILTDKQKDTIVNSKNDLNTTFDNWTTHSHVEYLAKAFALTKEKKYKIGSLKGIDFILSAQYANGGWPQYFPLRDNYSKYITFNDGVMVGIMTLLKNILDEKPYYSFVDATRRGKIANAFTKGMKCILKCQIVDNGKLTAWCQQNDDVDLHPQWARAFEPPSICNGESCGVVLFLMSIPNPGNEIINSIQCAVKWFDDSKIFNTEVKNIPAPKMKYRWRTSDFDRIVVADSSAPPIWTRYYELKTHRPLFCNRDSKVVYSLAEVDRERRSGYTWYTYDPQAILDKYPVWQKKWVPDQNVLKK